MIVVRVFIIYTFGTNLFSLVPERYVAVVKPLKYLTLMKRRRVIQMVLPSWEFPSAYGKHFVGGAEHNFHE